MRRPLLLGHRGARRCAPENTLAAFDLALAHGCDGFELDARRTADGCAVICHDATYQHARIAQHTYARLMERAAQRLCCLEDVLGRYAQTAFLDIELKDCDLEERVARTVRTYAPRRFVISSFLPEVITAMAACAPDVPLGLIADTRAALELWRALPVSWVMVHHRVLSAGLVQELHRGGKQAAVWTVNSQREMLRAGKWDVDAIISDNTEGLSRTFSEI